MTFWRGWIYVFGERAPAGAPRWDGEAYERAVIDVLERLVLTRAGNILFEALANYVYISPEGDFAGQMASAAPDRARDSVPRGAPVTAGGLLRGTGLGTWTNVYFTPGQWPRGRASLAINRGMALFTDESVLFHELVHALHFTRAVRRPTLLPDPYFSVEEHRAVTVSNVLLSELNYPLRASYDEHAVLGRTAVRTHEGYRVGGESDGLVGVLFDPDRESRLAFERRQVASYIRDLPSFTGALAALPRSVCHYNPFRAYREERYEEIPLTPLGWCAGACER